MSDAFHYLSLTLTNVRAYGGEQTLDLSKDGKPARWCVILGENGVGKTTLMQSLAVMRPFPSFGSGEDRQAKGEEADTPKWIDPELANAENEQVKSFVRHGKSVDARLEARLVDEAGHEILVGYRIATDDKYELASADPDPFEYTLASTGPLIIAYSAFRHAGKGNLDTIEALNPTAALFDEEIKLIDADELVERLDYAILSAERDQNDAELSRRRGLMEGMKRVIAALIPEAKPEDISMRGTKFPGWSGSNGMHVQTPSGVMPLRELSLGYQTMIAWVVDLAWRLFNHFPKSDDPFGESAIVLIDEIDLHLHPVWQRSLRERLLYHFPKIQFIVTTHSPVTAQESIAAGDPLSVVHWEDGEAVILSNPIKDRTPRLEQVLTEAFALETSKPSKVEQLLVIRRALIRKKDLTAQEAALLTEMNDLALEIQSGADDYSAELDRVMAKIVTHAEA